MKKNNKWLTLTLSLTFLLLAGACAGVASSLSSNSTNIFISKTTSEDINKIDVNLLEDDDWDVTYVPGSNLCNINFTVNSFASRYQFFVFRISGFLNHETSMTHPNVMTFSNNSQDKAFITTAMMSDVISIDNTVELGYAHLTFKYDKNLAEELNGYSNIISVSYWCNLSTEYSVDNIKNNYVYAAAYQNNDGIMLDPTTLF